MKKMIKINYFTITTDTKFISDQITTDENSIKNYMLQHSSSIEYYQCPRLQL